MKKLKVGLLGALVALAGTQLWGAAAPDQGNPWIAGAGDTLAQDLLQEREQMRVAVESGDMQQIRQLLSCSMLKSLETRASTDGIDQLGRSLDVTALEVVLGKSSYLTPKDTTKLRSLCKEGAVVGDYILRDKLKAHYQIVCNELFSDLFAQAIVREDVELVQLLLDHGIDFAKSVNYHYFKISKPQLVRLLLDHGLDVNKISLYNAVTNGHTDVVRLLLDYGVDVNKVGTNFLSLAVISGHIDIVRLLLGHEKIDVNKVDQNRSVLVSAVEIRNINMVALLLECGADPNNDLGMYGMYMTSPLMEMVIEYCSFKRSSVKQIIELLLRYGASVDAVNSWGDSALMYALKNTMASVELIGLLSGSSSDSAREKALQWAQEHPYLFHDKKPFVDVVAALEKRCQDDE